MSSATPSARGLSIWITALGFIAASALAQDRSWIERSDRNTAMVFETLGAFYPEWMASLGIDKFDTGVLDLKADRVKRIDAALAAQVARLSRLKAKESDPRVREDLDIVIDALEQQLHNCDRYIAGMAELFRQSGVQGWEAAHERLATQLRAHCDWVRSAVLPRARSTPALPRELYADRLKNVGVDITPEQAIALGTSTFAEVRD